VIDGSRLNAGLEVGAALNSAVNKGHPVNRRNRRVRSKILGLRAEPRGLNAAPLHISRQNGESPRTAKTVECGGYRRTAKRLCSPQNSVLGRRALGVCRQSQALPIRRVVAKQATCGASVFKDRTATLRILEQLSPMEMEISGTPPRPSRSSLVRSRPRTLGALLLSAIPAERKATTAAVPPQV
jgi:hypothetical protein